MYIKCVQTILIAHNCAIDPKYKKNLACFRQHAPPDEHPPECAHTAAAPDGTLHPKRTQATFLEVRTPLRDLGQKV